MVKEVAEGRTSRRFVGFYWTLPLPHLGFIKLPKGAEEAAAVSRTIRYQRERIRQHVAEQGGELVGEAVWIELDPDRGSRHVKADLRRAVESCSKAKAQLLYVDFAERHGWRPHQQLKTFLGEFADGSLHRPLDPDPIVINGQHFDPVEHFRQWQRAMADRGTPAERRQEVRSQVLAAAAGQLPPAVPRVDYMSLAAMLNREGIRTTTGRRWASDNLRMVLRPVLKSQAAKLP
jgi:hypothetical protein